MHWKKECAADGLKTRAIRAFANLAMSRAGKRIMLLKPAALPKFARLELHGGVFASLARLICEARESVNRERVPVEMIFQVKNTWKTGAGEFRLAPGAVFLLTVNKIGDSLGDG